MSNILARTEYGTFRITINDDIQINQETRSIKKIGKIITVGGKNKCVSINAPYDSDTAHLLNVKTKDGGCEATDTPIKGEKTIGMTNLAFTILKEEMPKITHIVLEDKSDFPCECEDGSVIGISLALYEIMFHQQTWYERHFGAYLQNEVLRTLYTNSKANFNKPPPYDFNFLNKDTNTYLQPQLKLSATWADFFKKVYKMERKCEIIFPWYNQALNIIFEGVNYSRQNWIIDTSTTKTIPYDNIGTFGGRSMTRKRRTKNISRIKQFHDFYFDELYNKSFAKTDFTI